MRARRSGRLAAQEDWQAWLRFEDPDDYVTVDDLIANAVDDGNRVSRRFAEAYVAEVARLHAEASAR